MHNDITSSIYDNTIRTTTLLLRRRRISGRPRADGNAMQTLRMGERRA
jgi:hypothetical protein